MTILGSGESNHSHPKTAVPWTSSLEPDNSTGSERPTSIISPGPPTEGGTQNSLSQGSSKAISIVGGTIGGLGFLVTVGVGVWVFLRIRRSSRRGVNEGHPGYARYPTGVAVFQGAMRPPRVQLYVGCFILLSNLFPD